VKSLLLTLLLFPSFLEAQSPSIPSTKPLILTNVTVIDVTGSPPKPDMSVVIRNHRIAAIGRTSSVVPPKDSEIVDATGKFLIPGLWDMHVHTGRKDIFFPLYIANGVTSVRDMGGDIEDPSGELSSLSGRYVQLSLWRAAIEEGSLLGPRLVIAGFLIDGFKWPGNIAATNAEEGRQAVDVLKKTGVDFVKVKSFLSKDTFLAIAAEARRQHMVLAGHVPDTVRVAEASNAGQKSIEHLTGIAVGCSAIERQLIDEKAQAFAARDRARYASIEPRAAATFDPTIATALFSRFVTNGTWQVPTLVELRRNALGDDSTNPGQNSPEDEPLWAYLPEPLRDWWSKNRSAATPSGGQELFASELSLTEKMHKSGVLFLAGTDTPNPSILPGFALHDELKLLVSAGFSPMEALQTATLNPARYLGKEKDLGTIETGKLADLVLLDANPLDDISNTRKIRAVIVDGRYLNRETLDAMLASVQAAAK
jgi:imidazolonepropionase-like amidohydrolase